MTELTIDQKRIVDTRNKNIIVSAAAGSGKTKVLVDRIIKLVTDDKKNIDSMIIVTFTNKASAEMRTRIQKNLEKAYKDADGNQKDFLKDQLKRLRKTHIQTLHSFCADMLRENFYKTNNISPNFRILDDKRAQILKIDAIDELFDSSYQNPSEGFKTFINNFGKSRNDENAKKTVQFAYEKIMDQVDPDTAIEKYFSQNDSYKIYRREKIEEFSGIYESYGLLINHNHFDKISEGLRDELLKEYANVENAHELIKNISKEEAISDHMWEKFADLIRKVNIKQISQIKNNKIDKGEGYNDLKATRDIASNHMAGFINEIDLASGENFKKHRKKEKQILDELKILVTTFADIYKTKKSVDNGLDFNDLEHEFINLISDEENLRPIKKQFDFIFFDEYQDANDVQNYIVDKLKKDDNLFFVGDVKQSIYGFRRANPELFLDKLATYPLDENADSKNLRIDLSQNFRTEKDILDFNNYVFDRLMTLDNSGIDYKDGHRLNYFKEIDPAENKVEIDIAEKSDDPYNLVADRILKLKNDQYTVEEEKDGITEKVSKNYDYKDIIILLRTGTKAHLYEKALKEAGIPVKNEIQNKNAISVEANFFIDMLKFVANPYDDITLLAVIRSEIFDFDEDDIAKIRLFSNFFSFNNAFYNYNKALDPVVLAEKSEKQVYFDQDLAYRITNFIAIFDQFRYESSLMNLYEFANHLFEDSGYYEFLKARDRSNERIKNVEDLIDLMGEFDQNNDNGLFGFLKYYDDLIQSNNNYLEGRALTENENFVRIMTVHKSKGLESKAVILANADGQMGIKDDKYMYAFDSEIGFAFKLVDEDLRVWVKSPSYQLIIDKLKSEMLREEMRILYVALTRAENKLVVSGSLKSYNDTIKKLTREQDYLKLNSHLEWILKAISNDKILEEISEFSNTDELNGIVKISLSSEMDSNFEDKEKIDINLKSLINDDYKGSLYEELKENFAPYKYLEATKDPLKKSVTEVSKNYIVEDEGAERENYWAFAREFEFKTPEFMAEKIEFSPVDKGTIIHRIFQNLPIKSYTQKEFNKELQKLIDLYKITQEEADLIEIDKILGFFNNDQIINLGKNARQILHEESFLMKHIDDKNPENYYYINGQIDLLFEFEDHIVLLDFKTDNTKREESYSNQLAYYKEAIEDAKGKKVTDSIIYWYNFKEFSKY